MNRGFDGNAIVYCQGAFSTPNGKTAHGLVRFSQRYRVLSVVDSECQVNDVAEVLGGARSVGPEPDVDVVDPHHVALVGRRSLALEFLEGRTLPGVAALTER